ncbi:MAG: UrcA family protein [Brevundimonas sp.]|nr:UrcA family protein [Brevundimonas sp.]
MFRTLLPVIAFSLMAIPAAAQDSLRIPVGDLDLSTAGGVAAFDARVASEARAVCTRASRLVDTLCVRVVTREAIRQLPPSRQDDYARARRSGPIMAMVAPGRPA